MILDIHLGMHRHHEESSFPVSAGDRGGVPDQRRLRCHAFRVDVAGEGGDGLDVRAFHRSGRYGGRPFRKTDPLGLRGNPCKFGRALVEADEQVRMAKSAILPEGERNDSEHVRMPLGFLHHQTTSRTGADIPAATPDELLELLPPVFFERCRLLNGAASWHHHHVDLVQHSRTYRSPINRNRFHPTCHGGQRQPLIRTDAPGTPAHEDAYSQRVVIRIIRDDFR